MEEVDTHGVNSKTGGSMSNLSDTSSTIPVGNAAMTVALPNQPIVHGGAVNQRPRMDIAVVIDCEHSTFLSHRKAALEEVRQACVQVGANLQLLLFEVLDYGDLKTLEAFYNADVVVVDLSVQTQQSTLCYQLGVRESFEMNENIVIYNDTHNEATLRMKISCGNYQFVSYRLHDSGNCVMVTSPLKGVSDEQSLGPTTQVTTLGQQQLPQNQQPITLLTALRKLFQDVEIQSKAHLREKFLADLRGLRDQHAGNVEELQRMLRNMRKRLDDPHVLSKEIVQTYMLSLRDVQDYDAMVQLVDDLQTIPNKQNYINTGHMHYLYAFALNRRNREGDRERALRTCTKALEKKENHFPDMLCLYGRIYKDMFVESNHTDQESLRNAIIWYRKSFEVQPNEFAGINLATLLVIDGKDFADTELQYITMKLNNLIGKKGSLAQIRDYWNVATFFEISVLAENYAKAIQAAECMFMLRPPKWYLKSTIGNITLIDRARKRTEEAGTGIPIEQQIFQFWMEFFMEATAPEPTSTVRFPILILEPQKVYMPSYVAIHMDAEQKSIDISNICLQHAKGTCLKLHDFNFQANQIKSVSLYKRDERCAYLYVQQNSDDFQMFFPSVQCRQTFYDRILQMTADQGSGFIDLSSAETTADELKYEYETDDHGRRIVLGKGTYGTVYAARDLTTQVKIAVKEVPERNTHDVQPLHEEIKLHSQLRHRNIVQYWGSKSEDNFFKIFMEQVPGGSLSALLRSKWGPLKETAIAFYSPQILEGLKYLHDQKIVHRDIKGDNVLVNTYSGVVKISDFGTSKRLAGINPVTETFTGTLQYMAPEVIDQGVRGYGPAADIWSFGCTVVEMATGKPPFIELGCPQAAMFKVGFYKTHPTIPPELSERAKRFILRCFEVNVDLRATAAGLLDDPFLCDMNKKMRPSISSSSASGIIGGVGGGAGGVPSITGSSGYEFARSVSMPADRHVTKPLSSQHNTAVCNTPTIGSENNSSSSAFYTTAASVTSPTVLSASVRSRNRQLSQLTPIKMPKQGGGGNSIGNLAETPSLEIEPADQTPTAFHLNRRSSSGVLLSPEVELTSSTTSKSPLGAVSEASESDGFYLLKKDSQRRTTLDKVLYHDVNKICEVWLDKIESDRKEKVVITRSHLETLLNALRRYITEQRKEALEQAIGQLKERLDFDSTAIDHLHLALYSFQDAVNTVLRSHNIKPHWMFALDNLVKSAVQAGIMILSPELGANLAGQTPNDDDDEYDNEDTGCSGVAIAGATGVGPAVIVNRKGPRNRENADRSLAVVRDSRRQYPRDEHDCVTMHNYEDCEDDEDDEEDDDGDENEEGYRIGRSLHRSYRNGTGLVGSASSTTITTVQQRGAKRNAELRAEITRLKECIIESQRAYEATFRALLDNGAFTRCLSDQLVALIERGIDRDERHGTKRPFAANQLEEQNIEHHKERNEEDKKKERRNEWKSANVAVADEMPPDPDRTVLDNWLQQQGIASTTSRQRILREGFRFHDFLYDLERDDLRRLGLRMGEQLRIWSALKAHRQQQLHQPTTISNCRNSATDENNHQATLPHGPQRYSYREEDEDFD
ncbi:mitogen-activated protein kinase kinase kinase 15 isoform X1 [Anopheles darlingi]|uniref:mitogen-activated protein kinase kinase kinase 15 isoform X1 n=2 Tax=Anopheles darlingi TaxID=43151 RepID=UPI00210010C2|nr:mitogen-activated protein kinase kinase kinase 15 isoform X1 [Anopheles darlingi]XP_049541206.1 mitogen-activated protein kinase kinase kinase 15 isoform X1 [Anopheles darlingi]XP_049541213.1 mitogen-activated protein kinase kinase kinase 15 isoform X1 [Anopheles darlingi]XP_049541223.1 mitogen-activated protein kinase kinase kinase 15 isoform X1 [Anopheles darlingi]XP_049541230.1 mitogen-activated protein kinase kinase kinase 15 isoform X1 [Anopheles darlingi]